MHTRIDFTTLEDIILSDNSSGIPDKVLNLKYFLYPNNYCDLD